MATATISKEFTFSASHRLDGLPEDHPCSRLHGHNYTVRLEVSGHTNKVGFVIDYRDLGFFKDILDDEMDHRDLNEVMGPGFNPTAENLATDLLEVVMVTLRAEHREAFNRLTSVSVAVSETPKTWATVTTVRHWEFPQSEEDAAEQSRHWGTGVPDQELTEVMDALDPHQEDEDRFRWNFATDGEGSK